MGLAFGLFALPFLVHWFRTDTDPLLVGCRLRWFWQPPEIVRVNVQSRTICLSSG
jgi:hypothetical protein